MIGREIGLGLASRVPQMVRQLGPQRALDQRFLESTRGGFDFGGGQRTVSNDLIENSTRIGARISALGFSGFGFAGHTVSSCYAPHTKFRTLSHRPAKSQIAPTREVPIAPTSDSKDRTDNGQ